MEIEDVARIGLAPRRLAREQCKLAVGRCVFRQVVIDDQNVIAPVAEPFGDRGGRERREPAQPRFGGRFRDDEDRPLQRAALPHRLDHPAHRRHPLTDRHIDADQPVLSAALIDHRIDRDRGLAGLPLAHDQLALAATDGKERIDHQEAGLDRLGHEITLDDRGGRAFGGQARNTRRRGPIVERTAERVEHAAQERLAHRDRDDLARPADRVARGDPGHRIEEGRVQPLLLQRQDEAARAIGEGHDLVQPRTGQARDLRQPVGDGDDGAALLGGGAKRDRCDARLQRLEARIGYGCVRHRSPPCPRLLRSPRDHGRANCGSRPRPSAVPTPRSGQHRFSAPGRSRTRPALC